MLFIDLQTSVKSRALRNQSGTEFDTQVKNAINSSIFRISREALWRVLRRMTHFDTVTSYSSGTGYVTVTNSSTNWSVSGANLFTDQIRIGRKVKFGTDGGFYDIRTIYSNSSSSLDRRYEGTTSTATTYEILPQSEYTIPMQTSHRMFMWHEAYGYPYLMNYIPDQSFFGSANYLTEENTPTHYRMWGEDMSIVKVPSSTYLTVQSSKVSDTTTAITLYGNIGGYPGSEVVTTSGTSAIGAVSSTNLFDTFERLAVSTKTNGFITIKSFSGSYTLAVVPQGDTSSVIRKKVQIYPLATSVFPINIYYYKDPFPLVDSGETHELGPDFDELIIKTATIIIKQADGQEISDELRDSRRKEFRSLRKTNIDKIDFFPSLHRPWGSGEVAVHSNLLYRQVGSYYGPRV